uniref:Replication factor A C-terminal domain-containing protein n=1 Tax=Lactuca sativa TaxID=4236 RepID=A0A9R1XSW5_LACSA|nr:hypothetical protein LSAT_V11C300141560 [Lactuca sativa]
MFQFLFHFPLTCHTIIFRVRVVIRVQDETGSASFVLFNHHVKDLIHHGNHWLMEKISKVALYYTILLICTHDKLTVYYQGHQKIPDKFDMMLNRNFVFKVQISKFNLENNYHAYTVRKMTNDEFSNIHLHMKKTVFIPMVLLLNIKSFSVEGDNINVVDLDAVTSTTTSLKRPIEIVTTTESFEWSSSKDVVSPHTLKIPKKEKLE